MDATYMHMQHLQHKNLIEQATRLWVRLASAKFESSVLLNEGQSLDVAAIFQHVAVRASMPGGKERVCTASKVADGLIDWAAVLACENSSHRNHLLMT